MNYVPGNLSNISVSGPAGPTPSLPALVAAPTIMPILPTIPDQGSSSKSSGETQLPARPAPTLPSLPLIPNINNRPRSPRDPTPLIVNGKPLDVSVLPKIALSPTVTKPTELKVLTISPAPPTRHVDSPGTSPIVFSPSRAGSPRSEPVTLPTIPGHTIFNSPIGTSPKPTAAPISSPPLTSPPPATSPRLPMLSPTARRPGPPITPSFPPITSKPPSPHNIETKYASPMSGPHRAVSPPLPEGNRLLRGPQGLSTGEPLMTTEKSPANNADYTTVSRVRYIAEKPFLPQIPEFSHLTPNEQASIRAEFRVKFGILRASWPGLLIRDLPDGTPLEEIWITYERYVRHVYISASIEQYRIYVTIGALLLEWFVVKIVGFNAASGFTASQLTSMYKYERLLIELGEKNYTATSSSWPVELRIALTMGFNMVIFVGVKMLANLVGMEQANGIVDALGRILSPGQAAPIQGGVGTAPLPEQKAGAPPIIPNPPPTPQAPTLGGFNIGQILGNLAPGGGLGSIIQGVMGGLGAAATPAPTGPPKRPSGPRHRS